MTPLTIADPHELRAVVSGLRRLRYSTLRLQAKNVAEGWTPEPGKHDTHKLRLACIDGLLSRLGVEIMTQPEGE